MKRIITLAAGFTVGYVAGAKAGRERYEQIQHTMHEIGQQPAVAETRESLRHGVATASKTVADKVAHVTSGLSHSSAGSRDDHSPNGAVPDTYSTGGSPS